jgi:hypothetical protein
MLLIVDTLVFLLLFLYTEIRLIMIIRVFSSLQEYHSNVLMSMDRRLAFILNSYEV